MPTHSCRSPPSQCGSCPKDWKDNPASCSTEPPASCAWLSLFRMHERMSCAGIVLRRFAGKDWLATVQRSSCSGQCRQPNLGAEACESKSHSDSKRLVPSQQVVPVREQPFREDLWVPACRAASVSWRSCKASRNSSPAPLQSDSTCARTIANCCAFARTVMHWSWSTPKPMQQLKP